MTTWSRQALAVWADERQLRGDRWGELVAASLMRDATTDSDLRLSEGIEQLRRELFAAQIDPILHTSPGLHPRWRHGLLAGLLVGGFSASDIAKGLAGARALLTLPCACFVERVWILCDRRPYDERWYDAALSVLLDPDVVARPRFVRVGQPGAPERRDWPKTAPHSRATQAINDLCGLDRHMVDLVICDSRYEMFWARARTEDMVAELRRWRDTPRANGLSLRDSTRIGRALWDTSLRVQLAALDLVESLGRDAAMFVPSLAAQKRGKARWRARVGELLDTLADNRELVGLLIDDFALDHYGMLEWFERACAVDDALLDRLERLVESNTMPSEWWVKGVVRSFVRKHRPV